MKLERELMRGAVPTAVMQVLAGGEKYGYELVEALVATIERRARHRPVDALSAAV